MVTTCEVSADDAATVAKMVRDLLAEFAVGHVQTDLDASLVADLLAMKERVFGFLAFAEERPMGIEGDSLSAR